MYRFRTHVHVPLVERDSWKKASADGDEDASRASSTTAAARTTAAAAEGKARRRREEPRLRRKEDLDDVGFIMVALFGLLYCIIKSAVIKKRAILYSGLQEQ